MHMPNDWIAALLAVVTSSTLSHINISTVPKKQTLFSVCSHEAFGHGKESKWYADSIRS